MDGLLITVHLRAEKTARMGMFRITGNLKRAALFHLHQQAAGIGAIVGADEALEFLGHGSASREEKENDERPPLRKRNGGRRCRYLQPGGIRSHHAAHAAHAAGHGGHRFFLLGQIGDGGLGG